MITHTQALAIVTSADPTLTPAENLAVRCISWHESNYGGGWKPPGVGSNNWGAITKRMPCDESTGFMYQDSKPDGNGGVITYRTCFRRYPTPEAGALDVIKVALKPNVRALIATKGLRGCAEGMFANHYYTGVASTPEANIAAYTKALENAKRAILAETKERDPFPKP